MEPNDLNETPSNSMIAPLDAPYPNSALFGRFGLRAGWGMAIFFILSLIFVLAGNVAGAAASGILKQFVTAQNNHTQSQLNIPLTPAFIIASRAVTFLGMLVICWFFSKAERRSLYVYGIGRRRLNDFLPGAFWGLLTLSLLILILWSLHLLVFDARLLSAPAAVAYGIKWFIAFFMVALAEEYMLRGYLQYTLTRGLLGLGELLSARNAHNIAFWIAALFMSVLFGAGHLMNAHENPMGLVMVFVAGMVFSYALWRTGSLWWAIGFHTAWDWAQSFLYGVPDSGQISIGRLFQTHPVGNRLLSGEVDGPEGSVYVIPAMLIAVLVIRFTTVAAPLPPLEPEVEPSGTTLASADSESPIA